VDVIDTTSGDENGDFVRVPGGMGWWCECTAKVDALASEEDSALGLE
jgi:hypothetical protein